MLNIKTNFVADASFLYIEVCVRICSLCKQAPSNWNFEHKVSKVSIRGRLPVIGNLTLAHTVTAFQNEIALKAPPGEWIINNYVVCPPGPHLLRACPTQTEFSSSYTRDSVADKKHFKEQPQPQRQQQHCRRPTTSQRQWHKTFTKLTLRHILYMSFCSYVSEQSLHNNARRVD